MQEKGEEFLYKKRGSMGREKDIDPERHSQGELAEKSGDVSFSTKKRKGKSGKKEKKSPDPVLSPWPE